MNRNKMVEFLINDDIDTVITMREQYQDVEYISNILACGFKGYENYTDEELESEYNDREFDNAQNV